MKIALVLDTLDPLAGGLERWTGALARHLAGRGHDVHVFAFAERAHDLPVTAHILRGGGGPIARARRIAQTVAACRPDVVHDTGTGWSGDLFHPQTGSRAAAQARLVATHPPAARLRAVLSPVSMARRAAVAALERRQLAGARRVVAVSRLVRAELTARYGIAPDRVTVIHNGVETARFDPARLAPLRAAAREALGAGDATLFLASAHNMRLKGIDTALRALARVPGARLVVAGAHADAGWLALAERLGVRGRAHFAGPIADMAPLFAAADALVHPTRWDACSLSTIEAGAAGLPVITTAANGAAELIRDGGFVLSDPEDAAALAARMVLLLDAAVRSRMGEAAQRDAPAHDLRHNLAAVEALLFETARMRDVRAVNSPGDMPLAVAR